MLTCTTNLESTSIRAWCSRKEWELSASGDAMAKGTPFSESTAPTQPDWLQKTEGVRKCVMGKRDETVASLFTFFSTSERLIASHLPEGSVGTGRQQENPMHHGKKLHIMAAHHPS